MNTIAKTNSNRRISTTSSVILTSAEALVAEAGRRYARRDYGRVEGIGRLLLQSSLPAAAGIGAYYVGLGVFNNGQGPLETARAHFENALRFAPEHYRQRARLSLATLLWHEREYSRYAAALELGTNASDPVARIEFQRSLAILHSLDGDSRRALSVLEDMWPMVMGSTARLLSTRYEYLNSLAVELQANGKHEQAREVIAPVIASPYFENNSDWQQTARELAEVIPNRGLVFFDGKGLAYADLLGTLATNYPRYTVAMLEGLREMAGEGRGN
jgi:tetratricopeptide (TPR) repeat protein